MSEFRDLYKNSNQLKEHQSQRRSRLLEEQRRQREENFSFQRDLREILTGQKGKTRANPMFKNNLMLSEWMMNRPDDIEDFLIKPCPKGVRCSLSTGENNKKTAKLYYKNGLKFLEFKTNLPAFTILDVIYNKASKKIYILDAIAFGDRDLINTDSAFRFFWLKSKFLEDDLKITEKENNLTLDLIMSYDITDDFAVNTLFQTHPIFSDGTELDGYLFYHKEGSYTSGETPTVLWLFSFMIEELFDHIKVNPVYNSNRPKTYTNYLDYIREFDERRETKKRRGKKSDKSASESMEVNEIEGDDVRDEMQEMIELEITGNDVQ